MTNARMTNAILDDMAKRLCAEWLENELTADEVKAICAGLFDEAEAYYSDACEEYWSDAYDPEAIASRQASHDASLIAAGRGHLLKG